MDYSELANYKIKLVLDYKNHKSGDEVALSEIINENDTWPFNRKSKDGSQVNYLIVNHNALQRVKRLSGMVYYKEPELVIVPNIENRMTAVVTNSMRLPSNRKYKAIDVVVGEANGTSVQIPYIVTMAYKRAYDRAVIDALELDSIVYAEDEADVFDKENNKDTSLNPSDQVEVAPYLKAIAEITTQDELTKQGEEIKKLVETGKLSKPAVNELKKFYLQKKNELAKGGNNGSSVSA